MSKLDEALLTAFKEGLNAEEYADLEPAKQVILDWVETEIVGADTAGCDLHPKPSDYCSSGGCLLAGGVNKRLATQRKKLRSK